MTAAAGGACQAPSAAAGTLGCREEILLAAKSEHASGQLGRAAIAPEPIRRVTGRAESR